MSAPQDTIKSWCNVPGSSGSRSVPVGAQAALGRRPAAVAAPETSSDDDASRETRAINDIVIGERSRRDMGDIVGLAANIAEIGLLQPIALRSDGVLIAGERRLRAAVSLGWTTIPVHVVDWEEVIRGEFAENVHRKDFSPSGLVALAPARPAAVPPAPDAESSADGIGARRQSGECHDLQAARRRDKPRHTAR